MCEVVELQEVGEGGQVAGLSHFGEALFLKHTVELVGGRCASGQGTTLS